MKTCNYCGGLIVTEPEERIAGTLCKCGSVQCSGSVRLTVADPKPVPKEVAVCPECGGGLWWQVTSNDGLRDMVLDCENEPDIDDDPLEMETTHLNWQSDWEPVLRKVRRWVRSGGSALNGAADMPEGGVI